MFDRRQLSSSAWPYIGIATGLLCITLSTAFAQYPGHIDTRKKTGPSLRAVAVLEWIGQPGKPSASRIIPISVFDGESYQPGGLYLARPEPLALESGTEYILQKSGLPKGLFDIYSAQDVQGYWYGYGAWKPMALPPPPPKLARARVMPQVVDDGRPHLKIHNNGSSSQTGSNSPGATKTSSGAPSNQPPPEDPDRPVLRRRPASSDGNSTGAIGSTGSYSSPEPETAIGGPDANRPHLSYGSSNPTDPSFEPAKLSGTPADLGQMIAVSDAANREPHPFTYSWANPDDAAKMRARMEQLAAKAIAPPAKAPTPLKRTSRSHSKTSAARRTRRASSRTPPPELTPGLTKENFKAYELTYGGGATVVFTAQTADPPGKVKYVTLIAQPDFYGVPQVIFKSVTGDDSLDETPKMRLVDAVDTKADNRGDLIFELRSAHDRQFVIYRVTGGQAEQVFTTGSLPLAHG